MLARRAESIVAEALIDTRVVLVAGARQVGKSTLVTRLVDLPRAQLLTLDDPATLDAARSDPVGFIQSSSPLIIDEIQRCPELLLPIKARVDADPRPGQFLLTGSAQILSMRSVPDALPGRLEIVDLWPLSQGEIDGAPDAFIDAMFAQGRQVRHDSGLTRADYAQRLVAGGFPGAQGRTPHRLDAFYAAYLRTMIERDVHDLANIERAPQLRALLPMLAVRVGNLVSTANLSSDLGIARSTVSRYLALLEEVFLIHRIPAFSRNVSTRATASPKLMFTDTGLAAHLLDANAADLTHPVSQLGPLLENFVAGELHRQATYSRTRVNLSHYRTRDGVEVDLVLSDRRGRAVGIEVKATATVRAEDFRGLRHLAQRLRGDMIAGIVLYAGSRTLPFGPGLLAMPISALWQVADPSRTDDSESQRPRS